MELWIRTADRKRLLKPTDIGVGLYCGKHNVYNCGEVLGEYATEERCLEIIDEIQKLLMSNLDDYIVFKECEVPQETLKSFMETKKLVVTSGQNSPPASVEITPCNLRVYEMPQE